MPNYAIIQNGTVANVISADSAFVAAHNPNAVLIDGITPTPGIGWTYNGSAFTAPAQVSTTPSTPPPSPVFSRTNFMRLFTDAEIQSILGYDTNTNLTAPQKSNVAEFLEYFRDADMVDVTNLTTVSGVNLLASLGLITSSRAVAILASRT